MIGAPLPFAIGAGRADLGNLRPGPPGTQRCLMPLSFHVVENPEPDFGRASWLPPGDVLPAIVPAGRFLIRAERTIVALSHVSVYPNGCMLDMRASVRGRDATPDFLDHLVLAVQFGTGGTAVMWDKAAPRWRPGGHPALALEQCGVQGDFTEASDEDRRGDYTIRLWLHPLPPQEPGTLSIVSPHLGPRQASCVLDGPAIVSAASDARPYWG